MNMASLMLIQLMYNYYKSVEAYGKGTKVNISILNICLTFKYLMPYVRYQEEVNYVAEYVYTNLYFTILGIGETTKWIGISFNFTN